MPKKTEKSKKLIYHPAFKSSLLAFLTIAIGILTSTLGSWEPDAVNNFTVKIILFVILCVFYLLVLGFYSTYEVNLQKASRLYESQNETFEILLSGIMNICKKSAEDSNKVIHSILKNSSVDLNLWSFDKACVLICNNIYDLLCKIGNGKDFEIIYDRLDESSKPETHIYVNAYANKGMNPPSVFHVSRNFTTDHYYDCELFNKHQSDNIILINRDEIEKQFHHASKEKRNSNQKKYNQYIAIPIFCDDQKMVGLLEITCLKDTSISFDEDELQEILSKYITPYKFFILVLHKLEKALTAKPASPQEVQL